MQNPIENFFKLPQPARFAISGAVGTILFYIVYEAMFYFWPSNLLDSYKGGLIWTLAYLLSILWQMELHARIVYRVKIKNYVKTLISTYIAYSASIVGSSVISFLMVDVMKLNSSFAFSVSITVTGVINYFFVSSIMDESQSKKV